MSIVRSQTPSWRSSACMGPLQTCSHMEPCAVQLPVKIFRNEMDPRWQWRKHLLREPLAWRIIRDGTVLRSGPSLKSEKLHALNHGDVVERMPPSVGFVLLKDPPSVGVLRLQVTFNEGRRRCVGWITPDASHLGIGAPCYCEPLFLLLMFRV